MGNADFTCLYTTDIRLISIFRNRYFSVRPTNGFPRPIMITI